MTAHDAGWLAAIAIVVLITLVVARFVLGWTPSKAAQSWRADPLAQRHAGWPVVTAVIVIPAFIIFARLALHWAPSNAARDWAELAANSVTVLGVVGLLIAIGSHRSSERRADSLRVHELFQDYLRMRFDASLSHGAGGRDAGGKKASIPSVTTPDSLEDQLAGSKLYALEEMLARVKRYGDKAPDVSWIAYSDPQYGPWIATLLTHLGQHKEAVIKSLRIYRECYTTDLIQLTADYLGDDLLNKMAATERSREVKGTRTPPTLEKFEERRTKYPTID